MAEISKSRFSIFKQTVAGNSGTNSNWQNLNVVLPGVSGGPANTVVESQRIAANAPLAVQGSKRMMRMGMNETFNDHVHHVYLQLLPLFQSDDFKEGMASFMEKRDPNFKGS